MFRIFRFALLLTSFLAGSAFAAGQSFDPALFAALQKEGKPILVMVHADWCPTCRAQGSLLSELLSSPDYKSNNALRADFDQQKEVVKEFKATMRSTLIVFRGGREMGRSTGDTKKDSIATLLKKSI